jgi:cell wall-associated NlpC family hydrolase
MQRFHSVPCSTSNHTTDYSSSQPTLVHSLPFPQLALTAALFRCIRRRIAALSIPATLLASAVLPAASQTEPRAIVFSAVPAPAYDAPGVVESTALSPYSGTISLGAPQTSDERAPRVATPSFEAVDIAMQYVGARYRYGGASPRGFDCSGLTMYVYQQLGVELPHQASAQFNDRFGQRIQSIEELAPGDLVFFKRTTKAGGITHVSLYVGDGMMVSANSPRTGVQHVSIHSSYWRTRFAGGLRLYR